MALPILTFLTIVINVIVIFYIKVNTVKFIKTKNKWIDKLNVLVSVYKEIPQVKDETEYKFLMHNLNYGTKDLDRHLKTLKILIIEQVLLLVILFITIISYFNL